MALYKTRAVVLKSINLSESDRLITFMTETQGKIKCVAKGARKIKNQFWGALEPMSLIHLIYFGKEHQSLFRLNHSDIIESFQTIRDDFNKLYTGVYFLDLTDAMILEGHQEKKIFNLLYQSLAALNQQTELESLRRLFEIRLLKLSGYEPQLEHCVICRSAPGNGMIPFNYAHNGILCSTCSNRARIDTQFSTGTRNYIKKLLDVEIKTCERLKFPKSQTDEIEKMTHRLVLSHLGRELKSYPFIKNMAELNI
ncbi:MAG: DNA repair protein RecO [Nitrospina sp.]|jgi:DNA repair protein RecO (recombination protein O)|nr:DNA repair protein RecO [Nitrospina sp.]MBT3875780.1 DNA repair protein RecO [Nitrospina sp.]MBT4049227.1 DNA repair protein RecO [Nitrospina sp.]MBT4557195.1 DNA repair protein RecO [Nitrospina sp.]MBT5349397.1 DNA repair protein RecO [Nitrospina sp.]